MKNKEKKNWNMSALRLSCIPRTRDSWFFGDTTCRIWVYIAAHKNHCYKSLHKTQKFLQKYTKSVSGALGLHTTRMLANAQRDGRPAEHRWRPLFNAAKFG